MYIGGAVDVYIPNGENVTRYDVNSLYPFEISQDIPVGMPPTRGVFYGDYRKLKKFKNKYYKS